MRDVYQTCRVLDEYIEDYFKIAKNRLTKKEINHQITEILSKFKTEVLTGLLQEKEKFRNAINNKTQEFKNIFEFSKSENLYLSNIYTRFISENLGHKFEDIAAISNQVFIPEKELGIRLKGVDLVIYDQGIIKYTQMKTKKDTLTGSQKDRTINELRLHPQTIFAAALDMGSSWTLSPKSVEKYNIELLSGELFWGRIGLEYNLILKKLAKVINELDRELYN